jgi:hypothetical protein
MGDFSKIISSFKRTDELGPDFVRLNVNSFSDLRAFVAACRSNQDLALFAVDAYAWDLFDKLYAYSISNDIPSAEDGCSAVQLLGAYVRPRELYIIVAEKLFSASDPHTLQLLLVALEIVLQRNSEPGLWADGKGPYKEWGVKIPTKAYLCLWLFRPACACSPTQFCGACLVG